MFKTSPKYDELLAHYAHMAEHGYQTRKGKHVENTYDTQEAVKFRHELRDLFKVHRVETVLDYGAGNAPWDTKDVPEGVSLLTFTGAKSYHAFEPSRSVDNRQICDAVVCFDVMEHIFLADVPYVLDQLFKHARRLVVVNVATYAASALLPTGENAHITQRSPEWWQGATDVVASLYPDIHFALYCSTSYKAHTKFPVRNFGALTKRKGYVR